MELTKQEILENMITKYEAYVSDYMNETKWDEYVDAWHEWRKIKGDE